jgi:hypothetical protein
LKAEANVWVKATGTNSTVMEDGSGPRKLHQQHDEGRGLVKGAWLLTFAAVINQRGIYAS